MADFADKPAYEIVRRLELRGKSSYSWFALIKPAQDETSAIEEFRSELAAFLREQPRVVDITGLLVDDLRDRLQNPPNDPVILTGFDDRSTDFWSAVDLNRSGLVRSGPVFFWLSTTGIFELCRSAPNLRSFIGASIFILGTGSAEMSSAEKEVRLAELSAFYHLSNEEVIRMAEARKLPPEPEFVEWLVLMGRGDLV